MGTYAIDKKRQIAHMDLDTFFVSVERLLDKKLENKPVIIGGTPFQRGVVSGCSKEARTFGIHSAMPLRHAFCLCPEAIFLRGNYVHYAEYSKLVQEIISEISPLTEKSSVDEFYLDLSGCERLRGNIFDWAKEIQHNVTGETQLPISFGLGSNKLIAKVATTEVAKKNEAKAFKVDSGSEASFLAPLPIRSLPSIGEVTEETLITYGMHHIGQIARTSVQLMQRLFGKTGKRLYEYANGIDLTPVIAQREQVTRSRAKTFAEDTFDVNVILSTLHSLATDLAEELRSDMVMAQKVSLTLRYEDFQTITKQRSVSYTNSTQEIYRTVEKLLRVAWTRRNRIRLIGVGAQDFIDDLQQLYLFDSASEEKKEQKIDSVLDTINRKYGNQSIIYASHLVH